MSGDHIPDAGKMVAKALRLAAEFKMCIEYDSIPSINDIEKAAAELCRLHAENEAAHAVGIRQEQELMKCEGLLRQALEALEAMEKPTPTLAETMKLQSKTAKKLRAALAEQPTKREPSARTASPRSKT